MRHGRSCGRNIHTDLVFWQRRDVDCGKSRVLIGMDEMVQSSNSIQHTACSIGKGKGYIW